MPPARKKVNSYFHAQTDGKISGVIPVRDEISLYAGMRTPQLFCLTFGIRREYHGANHCVAASWTAFRVSVEAVFHGHSPGFLAVFFELLPHTVRVDPVPSDLLAVLLRQEIQHARHELEDIHRHLAVRLAARCAIDVLLEAEGDGLLFDVGNCVLSRTEITPFL